MGGNTTNKRDWSTDELDKLLHSYTYNGNEFYNPITGKILKNKRAWKNSIAVKMSVQSYTEFLFRLEPPQYSILSGKQLTIAEFHPVHGFKKYTTDEIKTYKYRALTNYTRTKETKQQISNTLKQYNNTDNGIKARNIKSKRMVEFYSTSEGIQHKVDCSKKQSITMKDKIVRGEFTPNITNTWTHWNSFIDISGKIYKFRSSWEACFWFCNQHLKYETIRVKGTSKTYVSDFFDEQTNTLYEIKPINRYNIEIEKMTTLINYCIDNTINFVWINENNISNYIDVSVVMGNISAQTQYTKLQKAYGYNYKNKIN